MATCATTKILRVRWRSRLTLAVRPALRRTAEICGPAYFSAGINPKIRPETSERTTVNASAQASRRFRSNAADSPD
jgi:hypothetical protein